MSLELSDKNGRRIKINASVVDEIATLKKKDMDKFELLTRESADAVKRKEGYENITKENKLGLSWAKFSTTGAWLEYFFCVYLSRT